MFGAVKLVGAIGGGEAETLATSDGSGSEKDAGLKSSKTKTTSTVPPTTVVEVAAPKVDPDRSQGAEGPSGSTGLARIQTLGGTSMSPKSVVASSKGAVFAQNMMYRHSISVFNPEGALVKTIPDSVELEKFGVSGHPGVSKGAPVEMAFSPDGKTAWVSNYSMYGTAFGPEGSDSCVPGDGTDDSFVYRIDVATHEIQKVIKVGAVPKYVAVTPDGKKVLVTNWCTWDLSVIDTATNVEVERVKLGGKYPRGIVVPQDSQSAYVALMGSDRLVKVDLGSYEVTQFASPGDSPRHLVISPDDSSLYVTNNRDGNVVKIDRSSGRVAGSVSTGAQPRSMAISADGEAIYIVNYDSASMTKVRTSDMSKMQTVKADAHPIGITYEPTLKRVWVACYGGRVIVFDDSRVLSD
ncbi:MAG TPA: YncE family protein [Microthrixaceae bacterium]|nr:YncE family protein [Microthrixaceae bacterium]